MAKILVTDKISPDAISLISKKHQVEEFLEWEPRDLLEKIKGFEVLVVRSRTDVNKELIDAGTNLKIIARAGAGLDNVDKKHAESKGVKLLNTPRANSLSVAEMTLGLAISLLRNISLADKTTKAGHWEKKALRGREVSNKTWGIVGFGHIGQMVAKLLSGFECEILAHDPYVSDEVAVSAGAKLVKLDELLKNSDIVSIHVPLLESTRGLIGSKQLSMMKDTSILINISRGGIVDEKALYSTLKDKKILGAGLDVFEKEPPEGSPLLGLDNILLTCHLGAQTLDAQERVGNQLAEKILEALA